MDYSTKLIPYWAYNAAGALDIFYRLPTREEAREMYEAAREEERRYRWHRLQGRQDASEG